MSSTTKVNPGSTQAFPKITVRKMLSKTYSRLKVMDWAAVTHGLLADSMNLIEQQHKTDKYYCNLCEKNQPYFVHISNRLRIKWHSCCPACNARPRHRGLKELYREILPTYNNPAILHFAPEPVFYPIFEAFSTNYKTTDFLLEDVDYPREDIQALSFEDGSFDLVLCNHVIEHVPDDHKAIGEIHRILRPGGMAIFTIPGNWYKQHTKAFKDLSFNGHYRDYGMDVLQKFRHFFDYVSAKDLSDYNHLFALPLGITKKADLAFLCKK